MSVAIESEHSAVLHMKVLHRAHQLPIVKSAATYITAAYQQAKDYSPLVNKTLHVAESGLGLAGRVATPVISKLDGSITKLDNVACQLLGALEDRYPVISKDTDQVSASIAGAGSGVYDVTLASAGALLESPPGKLALMGLNGYLRFANKVADITLPADDEVSSMKFSSDNTALVEVVVLSDKLYRRVRTQSLANIRHVQQLSTDTIHTLQSYLTHLDSVKMQLVEYQACMSSHTAKLWVQLHATAGHLPQHLLAARGRTMQLARQMSSQLVALYAATATNLPVAVQSALDSSRASVEKLYKQLAQVGSSNELTALALSQIRTTLQSLQNSVSELFQLVASLPLIKYIPGSLAGVTERWESYMKPAQITETADT